MQIDTLVGGARSFRADGSTFLVERLKPGVLCVRAEGSDRGQFGEAVVGELAAELERFSRPMVLFVDARDVPLVHLAAQRVWLGWFGMHRDRLKTLHMLVHTPSLRLAVSIAEHYARIPLVNHADANSFEHAIETAAPGWKAALTGPYQPAAIHEEGDLRGVMVTDQRLRAELYSPRPGVLRLALSGKDDGTLANAIFDRIRRHTAASRPLQLFIDLRNAEPPSRAIGDLWTAWFAENRRLLASVVILATTSLVSLSADIIGWRSRTGGLVRVLPDPDSFARAYTRAAAAPHRP